MVGLEFAAIGLIGILGIILGWVLNSRLERTRFIREKKFEIGIEIIEKCWAWTSIFADNLYEDGVESTPLDYWTIKINDISNNLSKYRIFLNNKSDKKYIDAEKILAKAIERIMSLKIKKQFDQKILLEAIAIIIVVSTEIVDLIKFDLGLYPKFPNPLSRTVDTEILDRLKKMD